MADPTTLCNFRLFQELSPAECEQLARSLREKSYPKGALIVTEGHPADNLYLVQSGSVRVTRMFGETELTVATLEPNDHFGEMSLIDDHPHSASVVATGETVILELARADLQRLLDQSDSLKAKFWNAMAVELSGRIRATTNTMRDYVGINKALCENEKFREFYILCNSH